MALGEGTKAIIKEIAREIISESEQHHRAEMLELVEQRRREIAASIELHSAKCQANKYITIKNIVVGVIVGLVIVIGRWVIDKI